MNHEYVVNAMKKAVYRTRYGQARRDLIAVKTCFLLSKTKEETKFWRGLLDELDVPIPYG